MIRAIWNGAVLAEAAETVKVEGNHYFAPEALNRAFFTDSSTTTVCPWKGTAHYFTVVVDGEENADAAWYYSAPKEAAAEIRDRVAFWKGVKVEEG